MSLVESTCIPPPASCRTTCPPPAALHSLDGPGELGAELVVIHRLEHIVQRIHLIALDGVLRHVGHEHQHGVPVHGPYLFRRAEKQLAQYHFSRCNQCYLVNLQYVKAVENDFVHVNTDRLEISRRQRAAFLTAVASYIGGVL